ncbi:hypothetical protein KTN68_004882 [Salmonella enterica]|nr:hypothetical protein [Salmonella enterica]
MNYELKTLVNKIINKEESKEALNRLSYADRCLVAKNFPYLFERDLENNFRALVNRSVQSR